MLLRKRTLSTNTLLADQAYKLQVNVFVSYYLSKSQTIPVYKSLLSSSTWSQILQIFPLRVYCRLDATTSWSFKGILARLPYDTWLSRYPIRYIGCCAYWLQR